MLLNQIKFHLIVSIICFEELCNPIFVTKKGADSISVSSNERKSEVVATEGSAVHSERRKRFIDKKDIKLKQKQKERIKDQSYKISEKYTQDS